MQFLYTVSSQPTGIDPGGRRQGLPHTYKSRLMTPLVRHSRIAAAAALLLTNLLALPVLAQQGPDLSTTMEPVPGDVDPNSGARVESVEAVDEDTYKVIVSLPEGEEDVEEVIIVGEKEQVDIFKGTAPKKNFELINDPETGRRGLVFYVGKNSDFMLRFNYHQDDRFPPPPSGGPIP